MLRLCLLMILPLISILFTIENGLKIIFPAIVVSLLIYNLSLWLMSYIETLTEYKNRYENIYVVSNHPINNESLNIEHLNKYIDYVPHEKVIARKKYHYKLLKTSENAFFDNGLKEVQKIKVVTFIFQNGLYINESWEDFKNRVEIAINADREKRHEILFKANEDWYNLNANSQTL